MLVTSHLSIAPNSHNRLYKTPSNIVHAANRERKRNSSHVNHHMHTSPFKSFTVAYFFMYYSNGAPDVPTIFTQCELYSSSPLLSMVFHIYLVSIIFCLFITFYDGCEKCTSYRITKNSLH